MHRVLCLAASVVASIVLCTGAASAAELSAASPLSLPALALSDVKAEPQDTTAGARSPFDVEFTLNGIGDPTDGDPVRDLKLDLPPGLLGAITSADECAAADLQAATCADTTKLGALNVDLDFLLYAKDATGRSKISSSPAEMRNFGTIHRVPVRGAEPARLGIVIIPAICVLIIDPECKNPSLTGPPVVLEAPVQVRTATDGGLTTVVRDVPRTVPMNAAGTYEIDLAITTMRIRLAAASGRGDAFITNPTTCVPAETLVTTTTYAGRSAEGNGAFTPTDCAGVPFAPGIAMTADAAGADLPTGVDVDVSLPYSADPAARAQTQPKEAVVQLPTGFELSPGIGSAGLEGCTDAQFARGSAAPSSCPAGSQIGTASFVSPLIAEPVDGKVFLAQPVPGGPPLRIFIVAEQSGADDALRIKLEGRSDPDPATGQVTTTLTGIPPLTFTTFSLRFRGGPHAVFSTPRTCGSFPATASFAPHSGNAAVPASADVAVGGDCPDPNAFAPAVAVATDPPQAGAFATLQTTIVRPDRQARMKSLKMSLPPGLLGKLPGVAQCPLDAAALAQCGEATRVGTVTADAGPGPAPLRVTGPVYLSGPLDGSFASLAIVVPAAVGPINLGTTVTMARLVVRPQDQGLDVYADAIPLRQAGVAFSLRALTLKLDRPGFTLAPTSCDALPVAATLTSDLGGAAPASAAYQASGCDRLPFAPEMEAQLRGPRKRMYADGNPAFEVEVTQGADQANLKAVEVKLPEGIATNPRRLAAACKAEVFAAGNCPKEAIVGSAKAVTPLLGTVLRGDVIFVAQAKGGLPDLHVQLRGQLAVDLVGKVRVASNGQLITRFEGIPDVPIKQFGLWIDSGDNGLLVATEDMCERTPRIEAEVLSHSGATTSFTKRVGIPVCRAQDEIRISSLRDGRPALRLRLVGGPRKIQSLRLKLPSGLRLDPDAVERLIRLQASGMPKGAKQNAKVEAFGSRLDITFPGTGARTVNVLLRAGALRVSPALRRAARPRLNFRVDVTQPGLDRRSSTTRKRPVRTVAR